MSKRIKNQRNPPLPAKDKQKKNKKKQWTRIKAEPVHTDQAEQTVLNERNRKFVPLLSFFLYFRFFLHLRNIINVPFLFFRVGAWSNGQNWTSEIVSSFSFTLFFILVFMMIKYLFLFFFFFLFLLNFLIFLFLICFF